MIQLGETISHSSMLYVNSHQNLSSSGAARSESGLTFFQLIFLLAAIGVLAFLLINYFTGQGIRAVDTKIKEHVASMHAQAPLYTGIDFPVSPTTAPVVAGGGLFADPDAATSSLYQLIHTLSPETAYYYGFDGGDTSRGGKWFFAAKLSNGVVCTDWVNPLKQTAVPIVAPELPASWVPYVSAETFTCL